MRRALGIAECEESSAARIDEKAAPAPRRLTGSQRQRSIAFAAAEVFARRGYEAARIEEIARAAGISKALIYEHFESKRELYAHIMRKGTLEHLKRVLEAAAPGQNAVHRMERGLRAFLDFVAEQPEVFRVIEQQVSDPEIIALDQSQQKRSERALAELLAADERIAQQDLDDEQLELLAVMINGASMRAANWWIDNPSMNREAVLEMMMRLLWMGLQRVRHTGADAQP